MIVPIAQKALRVGAAVSLVCLAAVVLLNSGVGCERSQMDSGDGPLPEGASPAGEQGAAAGAERPAKGEPGGDGAQEAGEAVQEPLEWRKPRFAERREERARMVETQIARRGRDVSDERVLEAMRQVPRHLFVRPGDSGKAYDDRALYIGHGQTISQPYIVAMMTELLEVEPGDRVLEIGTGSGYQAAVLTELTPHVYSIEIVEKLARPAGERLRKLGYETADLEVGDGYDGWEEHAPFDGVIVTCAAGHIPPRLIEQLKPGGKMIIPVGEPYRTQYLVALSKDEKGEVSARYVLPVAFVPMTGRVQDRP